MTRANSARSAGVKKPASRCLESPNGFTGRRTAVTELLLAGAYFKTKTRCLLSKVYNGLAPARLKKVVWWLKHCQGKWARRAKLHLDWKFLLSAGCRRCLPERRWRGCSVMPSGKAAWGLKKGK